ncbi:translation initiation factor IF-2 [candidate division KSB1 bacterium]|nr:translation initiation factor IF-2 [candidate division KSB1 bacterium]
MSKKRRIYQVAKEFDISNDTLIHYLEKLGFDIRNHMSLMTDAMYNQVCDKYGHQTVHVNDEYEFRRMLKEKKAQEAAKKLEKQQKLEERIRAATEFSKIRPSLKRETEFETEVDESKQSYEFVAEETEDQPVARSRKKSDTKSETEADALSPKAAAARKTDKIDDTPPETLTDTEPTTRKLAGKAVSPQAKAATPGGKKEVSPEASEFEHTKETEPEGGIKARKDVLKKESRPEDESRAEAVSKSGKADQAPDKPVEKKIVSKGQKRAPSRETAKPPVSAIIEEAEEETAVVSQKADQGDESSESTDEKKKRRRRRRKKKKSEEKVHAVIEDFDESGPLDIEDEYQEIIATKKDKKKTQRRKDSEVEKSFTEKRKDKTRKKKKKKKTQISDAEVEESIRKTFASMDDTTRIKKRRKKAKDKEEDAFEADTATIKVSEYISAAELADHLSVEPSAVIKKCFELGMMVSINQRLDMDTIESVADEFGYSVEILPEYGEDLYEEEEIDEHGTVQERPPVVTIMGHVDHGKTSLLDYIRESNIIAGEAGGITQHIGAYEVAVNGKAITFLDTPGHEAFTAMRARGAQATDIVVLVVAADDAVMPQTIEAINHAKAAGVPIIVAINKIDKPNANIDLIKKQLAEHNVLIEEWGGKYQSVEISAKFGTGIDKLLDLILLEAEILELKANRDCMSRGVVIESKLDKGKGIVATVLVQKGTLKIGDPFISGQHYGKVRNLYDERSRRVAKATPSTPVQVVGFTGMPAAGDNFIVFESERDTREISFKRQQLRREQEMRRIKHLTLDEISEQIKKGGVKELSIIVKGDMDGSVQALSDSLMKLTNSEVAIDVIHRGVGAISLPDVLLASASNAIIIGFHVRPTLQAREVALREKVDIRLYTIIYDAIAEVKDALEGLLEPEVSEEVRGTAEVRATFRIPKIGTIAGCYVVSGKIARNDRVKLYREDKLIYNGRVNSLKRWKEDAREVSSGFECGIGLEGFDDIKVADIIEPYRTVSVKRRLASVAE